MKPATTEDDEEELGTLAHGARARHHEDVNMEHDALLDNASDDVQEDVREFAERYGLEDKLQVLQKAALVVQDSTSVDQIPSITATESRALRNETEQKWTQPFLMYLCIIVTACGSMGQGMAQTGINGANLYYPKLFKIGSNSLHDTLVVGFINCGIYLSNGLLGSWLVAPVNDRLGRRGAVFAGAVVALLFNVLGSMAENWQQLLICRLALGVGLGVINTSLNVFAAECAPAAIRGGLGVAWQMFCAFGIFISFLANMQIDSNPEAFGPLRWRLMLLVAALPNLPLLLLIFACPESPAWSIKHGERYDHAFDALRKLRNTELQAARELYASYLQRKRSAKLTEERSYLRTIRELFTIPRIRRATQAAYTTMLAQQLCGINIIAFYSSTIFVEAHFSPYAAETASTIFGLVNFLGAFPAVWTMDSFGRRSLLLFTLPLMAVTMFITGISFSINDDKLRFGLTTGMIYLFCLLYSPGMGPVTAPYSAEVFPLSHRELGTSSAVAVTSIFASILSLTFPALLATLGTQGSFLLYAILNAVAWTLVFLFVPETKRKSLEELDETFSISTRRFISYQVNEFAPYWTKRYILRQKSAVLETNLQSPTNYTHLEQEEA